MPDSFSNRHGFRSEDAEIAIRDDAPRELRFAIPMIAQGLGMSPTAMRRVVCQVLLVPPDPSNWSEYPNVWEELNSLLNTCDWFKVYDVAEALHMAFRNSFQDQSEDFSNRLNQYFRENGIGWSMKDGQIIFRGSEAFQDQTREAVVVLDVVGRKRAALEIREALRDISRRPNPDTTGAIQHAMAAMESTVREVVGDVNRTLGQLVRDIHLPKPLDTAVEKLWGYASDRARHVREGQTIDTSEAELLVGIACSVCTFLSKRTVKD